MSKAGAGSSAGVGAPAARGDEAQLERTMAQLRAANAKLECKVDILTSVVAMKDALLKTSDERFAALKWEVLHEFHGDDAAFAAMAAKLREEVHGWQGEVADGTTAIAPLVVWRCEALERRLGLGAHTASELAEALADVLPEFRRDFLVKVVSLFGPRPEAADVLAACHDAYADALRAHAALAKPRSADGGQDAGARLGRAARGALAATARADAPPKAPPDSQAGDAPRPPAAPKKKRWNPFSRKPKA
ncbi:hypothetical protein M885DRAFT_616794 [Pelagophyceae sp. CCMP2097]|nr:hypothetical protein M885DRAFT_616794 [Pelagophyceae sp. CCMP2097]